MLWYNLKCIYITCTSSDILSFNYVWILSFSLALHVNINMIRKCHSESSGVSIIIHVKNSITNEECPRQLLSVVRLLLCFSMISITGKLRGLKVNKPCFHLPLNILEFLLLKKLNFFSWAVILFFILVIT